jgi:hypothetical protein
MIKPSVARSFIAPAALLLNRSFAQAAAADEPKLRVLLTKVDSLFLSFF